MKFRSSSSGYDERFDLRSTHHRSRSIAYDNLAITSSYHPHHQTIARPDLFWMCVVVDGFSGVEYLV
jgi:hypothetical protein